MRDAKTILTGRGLTTLILAAVFLAGCGDAQKRHAGKNLREATDQARQLYSQALKLIGTPATGQNDQPDSLDPKALACLDQAQNILTASLSANYDAIKSNPDDVPNADVGLAKVMLSMVDHLRAQYYIWGFDLTLNQADSAMSQLRQDLDKAQMYSVLLSTTETYATLSDDVIRKTVEETQTTKTALDETVANLNKDIQQKVDTIAGLKKGIEEKISQATALRTEQALSRGEQSQQKLVEALKIEAEANLLHNQMQKVEAELVPLRTTLAAETIRQNEAQMTITALKDIQAQRTKGVEEITQTLEERKEEFANACKAANASMASLDSLVSKALEQATKADASLTRADGTMDQVFNLKLLDADKRAAALSESAHIKADKGALQRSMFMFYVTLKDVSDRLARVWDGLHSDKPSQPATTGIAAFLDASVRAQETALDSYAKSVDLFDQAVRAAPRESSWQFKRELIVAQLDYARVLTQAGRAADATKFRDDARTNFADVEAAATRANKPRSVVALKMYLLEEAGS